MKSKFRISGDQVVDDARQQKARGSTYGHLALPRGVNVFKEEANTRVHLDFLPYIITDTKHPDRNDDRGRALPDTAWYKRPYRLHRNVGVANEGYVCPTSVGKRCPICEHRARRVKENADRDELKELKPSQRNLYIVVPKDNKNYEEKPHIWDISQYLFQEMLNAELEEDPNSRKMFAHPEDGLTLKIRFGENQIGQNKFAEVSRIDFEARDYTYDDAILEKVPNLDECLIVPSYELLHAKFFELDDDGGPEPKIAQDGDSDGSVTKAKKPVAGSGSDREPQDKGVNDKEPVTSPIQRKPPVEQKLKKQRVVVEDEDEEESPKLMRRSRTPQEEEPARSKCPHGHRFGKDCEKFVECDDCEVWEACYEMHTKLKQG